MRKLEWFGVDFTEGNEKESILVLAERMKRDVFYKVRFQSAFDVRPSDRDLNIQGVKLKPRGWIYRYDAIGIAGE